MAGRYVIDTVSLINYYNEFFEESDALSKDVRQIIDRCINEADPYFKLIVPSIVFVEIFKKFLKEEERSKRFFYNIYIPLKENDDVEIKGIEREVLNIMTQISIDHALELHDKIIYASAIQLECPLISIDQKIVKANRSENLVPRIIF
jgi:PIN domain nuclease of toxin-antitoxin system